MALTYSAPTKISIGGRFLLVQPVVLDNSYPTAGYVVDQTFLGQLPDGLVDAVFPAGINQTVVTATVIVQYNQSTGKLQAFWSAATGNKPLEVTSTTDLSAFTFNLIVIGR